MLSLPAQLTFAEAHQTLNQLAGLLQQEAGEVVAVEAGAVQQIDTAALAVLLDLQRQARAAGKRLMVHHAPERLVELATLYGVGELLSLQPQPA